MEKVNVAKRTRNITKAEEDLLTSMAVDWLQPIITFAVSTGMRRGEIHTLGNGSFPASLLHRYQLRRNQVLRHTLDTAFIHLSMRPMGRMSSLPPTNFLRATAQ